MSKTWDESVINAVDDSMDDDDGDVPLGVSETAGKRLRLLLLDEMPELVSEAPLT